MRFSLQVFSAAVLIMVFGACNNQSKDVRYIEYQFEDAAKSAEYRRDYTIHFAPTEASAEITNGDSLLATGRFSLNPGQFDSIRFASSDIFGLEPFYLSEDCGGCNEQTLIFRDSARNTLKRVVWNGGRAPASLLLFKEQMMDRIDPFNFLLQSTFPKGDTLAK